MSTEQTPDSGHEHDPREHDPWALLDDAETDEELSLLERAEADIADSVIAAESEAAAERVYQALLTRVGEANPRPRIEPVRRFAELAGSPHTQFPVIHVAGTNGKTSTCRAIESLLRAHGLRTGLFSSPHLVSFTERFQLEGEAVDGTVLENAWDDLQPALEIVDQELARDGHGPITFFEALAVLAFAVFADAPVDVAVIEVGLGGEWDATNIVNADVAVFTSIDLDHTALLGDNTADIARTKSRIIKQNSAVVSAKQDAAAAAEITAEAQRHGATAKFAGQDFRLDEQRLAVGGQLVTVTGLSGHQYAATPLPLFGAHQAENATVAVAAVEAFFGGEREIPAEVYEAGLAQLTSPGRMQLLSTEPTVYVDAAHNPHGGRALAETIEKSFDFHEVALVFGALNDKDAAGTLEALLPQVTTVTLVPVDSPRSLTAEDIETLGARLSEQGVSVTVAQSLAAGLDAAREWAEHTSGRGVVVAGSVVLAGEAIAHAKAEGYGTA